MWVTNRIPFNQASSFPKSLPFNALILLDADNAESACKLIRDAEGPRHIDIELKRLGPRKNSNRSLLENFFRELHDKILELAPEQDDNEFDPGFFNLNISGVGIKHGKINRRVRTGTPESIPEVDPSDPRIGPKVNPSRPKPNRLNRFGRRAQVKSTITQKIGGVQINALPIEDIENAELRIVIGSGADSTCDNPDADIYLEMDPEVTLNGESRINFKDLNDQKRVAVKLGKIIANNSEYVIWVPCKSVVQGELRAEFVHRSRNETI